MYAYQGEATQSAWILTFRKLLSIAAYSSAVCQTVDHASLRGWSCSSRRVIDFQWGIASSYLPTVARIVSPKYPIYICPCLSKPFSSRRNRRNQPCNFVEIISRREFHFLSVKRLWIPQPIGIKSQENRCGWNLAPIGPHLSIDRTLDKSTFKDLIVS